MEFWGVMFKDKEGQVGRYGMERVAFGSGRSESAFWFGGIRVVSHVSYVLRRMLDIGCLRGILGCSGFFLV